MNCKHFNLKNIAGVIIIGISVAACNNSSSSDKIADTASTPAYSSPDATQQPSEPANTVDSLANSMNSADTSSSSNAPKTAGTSAAVKKKGNARVIMGPALKNPKIEIDKSGVYTFAEVSPAFPGGQNAIDNYINNHIEYPQSAIDENKEGRVGVSFVVDETGKVTDVHSIGRTVGYGLDNEAVRVVSNMPKWNPGTVKGKPVKTRMTLPIVFQIEQ